MTNTQDLASPDGPRSVDAEARFLKSLIAVYKDNRDVLTRLPELMEQCLITEPQNSELAESRLKEENRTSVEMKLKEKDKLLEESERKAKCLEEECSKLKKELEKKEKVISEIEKVQEEKISAVKKESENKVKEISDKANQLLKEKDDLQKMFIYGEYQKALKEHMSSHDDIINDLAVKDKEIQENMQRHASFSERRVRSDQRRTENTLSTNRQSQLESEYVFEFKDGTRVDAIDIITTRVGRYRGSKISSTEYLKCCRLACFIFEIAYEVVVTVKESFAAFTCTVMEMLVDDAPLIGSDNKAFQNKFWRLQYSHPKETLHTTTQDALGEVMILVKERAKTYDLNFLVQHVKSSVSSRWNGRYRDQLLLDYDSILLHGLNDYIKYCTQFAWCAVTQVPPLKIDYSTAAYSSRSHTVSQAFSFTEERSPTRRPIRSESRTVLCYLWPTLQDYDGKVIRKGEVILNY